jgi:DNA-binding Lrp family transcriptional regulator
MSEPDVQNAEEGETTTTNVQQEILKKYLDEYDYQIFKALNEDGRMSDTELADRVGLSRTAVSRRREKLTESGVLKVLAVIVLQEMDLAYADASIVLNQRASAAERNKLIRELMNSELIYSVDSCMGPYDVFIRAWHGSLGELKSYLWECLEGWDIIEEYQIIPVVDTWKAWDQQLDQPE